MLARRVGELLAGRGRLQSKLGSVSPPPLEAGAADAPSGRQRPPPQQQRNNIAASPLAWVLDFRWPALLGPRPSGQSAPTPLASKRWKIIKTNIVTNWLTWPSVTQHANERRLLRRLQAQFYELARSHGFNLSASLSATLSFESRVASFELRALSCELWAMSYEICARPGLELEAAKDLVRPLPPVEWRHSAGGSPLKVVVSSAALCPLPLASQPASVRLMDSPPQSRRESQLPSARAQLKLSCAGQSVSSAGFCSPLSPPVRAPLGPRSSGRLAWSWLHQRLQWRLRRPTRQPATSERARRPTRWRAAARPLASPANLASTTSAAR